MAIQTPDICKWTNNEDIDKELSNELWNTLLFWTRKNHALSNFAPAPTWAKPEYKPSLVDKDSLLLLVLFVIHMNLIHGYMYY